MSTNAAVVVWPGRGLGHYGEAFDTVEEALEAVLDAEFSDGSRPSYVLELLPAGSRELDFDAELADRRRDALGYYRHLHATRVSI